jgi:hypothetical protein
MWVAMMKRRSEDIEVGFMDGPLQGCTIKALRIWTS